MTDGFPGMKKRWDPKATAVAFVVVFLLATLMTGCGSASDAAAEDASDRQTRPRRRAGDYSRIPSNYPAAWQNAAGGY